ncbi:MAG: class I SAM-dependent methyltransferase [Verrucomicrobiota bacterium]|jgi:ubiquinone/menaquinone biosynthesis C-methylase UbiE
MIEVNDSRLVSNNPRIRQFGNPIFSARNEMLDVPSPRRGESGRLTNGMNQPAEPFAVEIDPFYIEDLRQMARAQNYQRWQFQMVAPFLGGEVLEVGGGIGNFTPQIASVAHSVTSLEPNEFCFRQLREKIAPLQNAAAYRVTVESLPTVMPAGKKFDAVVMMNVLEHIQDDRAVLAELKKYLAPGGRIVVLVPACQWAFGPTDTRLGHYRRYTKAYTRQLVADLQLELKKIRYYNFVGIWGWWWNAKWGRRASQSDAQIRFFDGWIVPVMSRLEEFVPPPVGQSLLFVARDTAVR